MINDIMTNDKMNDILNYLPYKSSFLFVDSILHIDEDGVTGDYTLKPDSFFYEDHFPGNPVTPGVIITEIMAQIGLVVLGIYLMLGDTKQHEGFEMHADSFPLLTSTNVEFYKMVLPEEKVIVTSRKQYFRFGKLKCTVEMRDTKSELIAKGVFSGVIKNAAINKNG